MKFFTAILTTLAPIVTQGKNTDIFLEKDEARLSNAALDRFKQKGALKRDYNPVVRQIPKGARAFEIAGMSVSIDDLEPFNDIFAPGARVRVNGVENEPKTYVYTSKSHPGVQVVLDDDHNLIKASARQPNGNEIDLLPIIGSQFAEVDADNDIDFSQLEDLEAADVMANGGSIRKLRGQAAKKRHHRKLLDVSPPSPACSVMVDATIYIAADSDFVADAIAECDMCNVADAHKALAAIEEVFAATRELYRRELCIDLTLKGVDIKTDRNNDPYRDIRLASSEVCGSSGFLWDLSMWLLRPGNDPSRGDRTLFHLFYGNPQGAGGRLIGCGWIGTSCSPWYGVSISEMTYLGSYSSSLVFKRNLFAHEIGHNFGSNHGTQIMSSSVGWSDKFSSSSVSAMQKCINEGTTCFNDCLVFRDNSQATLAPTHTPTGSPTNKPTYSPTSRATTLKPTASPTESPTSAPTDPPLVITTIEPTPRATTLAPTTSPTEKPTSVPTDLKAEPTSTPTDPPLVTTTTEATTSQVTTTQATTTATTTTTTATTTTSTEPATLARPTSNAITRIFIVDIDTDQDVFSISPGESFVIPSNMYRKWNIRAETTENVKAVTWYQDGSYASKDKFPPFSYAREFRGDFWGAPSLAPGKVYRIVAEPWDEHNGGNKGGPFVFDLQPPSQP